MNDEQGRKDIFLIAKLILGAIGIGLAAVSIILFKIDGGGLLSILWALTFLICGGGIGFLFGIPRILTEGAVNANPPVENNAASFAMRLRSNYRPSTNLERISEWLTTLIVGLTLVQWDNVVRGFNLISLYVSSGINPANPAANSAFASAIMLYFSVTGFLGTYLMTRTYLSPLFERTDVGNALGINDIERRQINNADLSNPRNLSLTSNLDNVARKALDTPLEQLNSIEDIIAWSKAQLAAGNYERAVEGYKKAVAIVPSDIQLLLEYTNALYFAGEATTDGVRKLALRAESEAQLLKAYNQLGQTTNPELKMKVYRAITYFYLFSDLNRRDFDKTIRFGEEFDADTDPRKITSVGILVNLASAYGQRFKWLANNNGSAADKEQARQGAFEYILKTLAADRDGRWLKRLQTLLRTDIQKDPDDDDLEVFENDPEFRNLLKLPYQLNEGNTGNGQPANIAAGQEKVKS